MFLEVRTEATPTSVINTRQRTERTAMYAVACSMNERKGREIVVLSQDTKNKRLTAL